MSSALLGAPTAGAGGGSPVGAIAIRMARSTGQCLSMPRPTNAPGQPVLRRLFASLLGLSHHEGGFPASTIQSRHSLVSLHHRPLVVGVHVRSMTETATRCVIMLTSLPNVSANLLCPASLRQWYCTNNRQNRWIYCVKPPLRRTAALRQRSGSAHRRRDLPRS